MHKMRMKILNEKNLMTYDFFGIGKLKKLCRAVNNIVITINPCYSNPYAKNTIYTDYYAELVQHLNN